jgi:hypothetical protein
MALDKNFGAWYNDRTLQKGESPIFILCVRLERSAREILSGSQLYKMQDFCVKKMRGKPLAAFFLRSLLLCTKRTFCKQKRAFGAEGARFCG